jgi:hypothetical protein
LRRRFRGGFGGGGSEAAGDFGLEIVAQGVGEDAGSDEFAEVAESDVREEREDHGQRGARMADNGDAHVIEDGPAAMTGGGDDDRFGKFIAGERFEEMAFVQVGIIEDDFKNAGMAFGEKRGGEAAGAAARQSYFLPQRQLREACEELLFGFDLEFGFGGDGEGELDKIHEIEIAEQAQADEAGHLGMKDDGALDAVIFQQGAAAGDLFENFGGEILAFEEKKEMGFVEGGIVEHGADDFPVGMVDETVEIFGGGGPGAFADGVRVFH